MTILPIPYGDPVAGFAPFAAEPFGALLGGCGRYGILAPRPFRVIGADAAGVRVDGVPVAGDPFSVLARELACCPPAALELPEPYRTGAIGFFGYETSRHLERLPAPRPDRFGLPDMVIGFYDLIAVFDHHERTALVVGNEAINSADLEPRAHALARRLSSVPPPPPLIRPGAAPVWRPELSRRAYESRVAAVIDYIRAGDIFQANFTQGFHADLPPGTTAFELYRRLEALAPAPYAAFLACGAGVNLCSASPEQFLGLDAGRRVITRPIKGTRPRGLTPGADRALLAELCASAKDRAENLMICDLLRNDLGRVCEIGSVRVPRLIVPETFAAVHHLVSEVEGRLRPGLGPVDLLRACFPGGSVTGAPKIRAMEIIEELEADRRGPYCGAIVRIGFDGTMDSAVTIRTLSLARGRVVARAGGGIVADSVPAEEYREMRTKIAPLLATLGPCHDDDLAR